MTLPYPYLDGLFPQQLLPQIPTPTPLMPDWFVDLDSTESSDDAINPKHYKDGWSNGAELVEITENLTSNGGQAVQYIARSTRLDPSLNKGNTVEDLEKAIWLCKREIERVEANG